MPGTDPRFIASARRALLLLVLLVAAACAATATPALAATAPPEGIFEGCPLDTEMSTCLGRLTTMHQGGMQIVVFPATYASLPSLATYAAAAHSLGMSVMWELSNPGWWQEPGTSTDMSGYFGDFAAACGCSTNSALLDYTITWLSQQPGTYGYYAVDDSMIGAGDHQGVAAYTARIKQIDPAHTVMIGAADEQQSRQYQSATDVIGTEIYPVTDSSLMPVTANQDMWGSVAQTASDAQAQAARAGRQSAFILQAFTWGDNIDDGVAIGVCSPGESKWSCHAQLRYPSRAEQLQLRNEVLRHAHPKLILWWSFPGTFGQAGDDSYSIYPTGGQATSQWSGLSAAVQAPLPGTRPGAVVARVSRVLSHHRTHRTRRGSTRRRSARLRHFGPGRLGALHRAI